MISLSKSPLLSSRYPAAIVAGVLLTAAFPKIEIAGLAWIAPGLMAACALGRSGVERWRIGYVAGLAHYLSLLYWLLLIPYRWHGLPLGPLLGWLALSGFLALFPALWVWLITHPAAGFALTPARSAEPHVDTGFSAEPIPSEPELLRGFGTGLPRRWIARLLWMLCGAAAWVALEMVLARIFGGFPWCLLGTSQYRMAPLIQLTSVTGVYGLSFIIVWVSLALLSAALMVIRRPTARSVWVAELFLPLMVVAFLFNQGLRVLKQEPAGQETVRIALVQPSIPQDLIWDPGLDTNRFSALVSYTEQILTNKPDVLIWPESAVPKMVRYDQPTYDAIAGLAKRHKIWVIIGSDDVEPRRDDPKGEAEDDFNSSFLISPEGILAERYLKRNLVIFGEYVPLRRWLPFLGWFTPVQGGYTAGTHPVPFHLRDLNLKASVLICFEDIFPQLGRDGVEVDTDFLVNITNDGWFSQSAAQWQHAVTALFRAVENHVPLIRCCNNGLTCWIDATGNLRQVLRDSVGTVYGRGYLIVEVPVREKAEPRRLTYYNRNGDVFGWACVGIAIAMGAVRISDIIRRRKSRGKAVQPSATGDRAV